MKFLNVRSALLVALLAGVAVAASLIAYAGGAGIEAEAAPQQPAMMSIPF